LFVNVAPADRLAALKVSELGRGEPANRDEGRGYPRAD
jgi:hypothetical protein